MCREIPKLDVANQESHFRIGTGYGSVQTEP